MEKKIWISVTKESLVSLCSMIYNDANEDNSDIEVKCDDNYGFAVGYSKGNGNRNRSWDVVVSVRSTALVSVMRAIFDAGITDIKVDNTEDGMSVICWKNPAACCCGKTACDNSGCHCDKNRETAEKPVDNSGNGQETTGGNDERPVDGEPVDGKPENEPSEGDKSFDEAIMSELDSLLHTLFPGSKVTVRRLKDKEEIRRMANAMSDNLSRLDEEITECFSLIHKMMGRD